MEGKTTAMAMVFIFMIGSAGAMAGAVNVFAEPCIVEVSNDGTEMEICVITDEEIEYSEDVLIAHRVTGNEGGSEPRIEPVIPPEPDEGTDPGEPVIEPISMPEPVPATMTIEEVLELAGNSACVEGTGTLTDSCMYNGYTGTWWIDMEPVEGKEYCSPACVVYDATGEVEINWRCTGAIAMPEPAPYDGKQGVQAEPGGTVTISADETSSPSVSTEDGAAIGTASGPAKPISKATDSETTEHESAAPKANTLGPLGSIIQAITGFFSSLFGA